MIRLTIPPKKSSPIPIPSPTPVRVDTMKLDSAVIENGMLRMELNKTKGELEEAQAEMDILNTKYSSVCQQNSLLIKENDELYTYLNQKKALPDRAQTLKTPEETKKTIQTVKKIQTLKKDSAKKDRGRWH